ncbi:thioredoxin [Haloferax volcanii JCM 10717]|uniref:Thioredoxin n=2 Tax=Haloferax volcanii TaxID=2246 RepID=M0I278_HALVO|nr:thioredoxin [Haloferax sp. BAB-2207]ELZ58203.1 thioredoxin [Haloferax sp. ATCC BAA-646]ELZ62988.1 thioredoxin [Haloferax sp. ATCC BAA-645]ELZ63639.1 thioredoxin [Haloferax sp. ATCC BAA-644]ELZ70703.1 thioredoxin [Haloferax lucentense DSM 14919]ELZ90910.1 thioredoxin [Haloferax alexandrinus JCM 10717]
MDFYADWCGPCKTQDPILDELEGDYETVEFVKVDVDEEQDVANQYQVRSLPTLIVENDDGIVDRFVGVTQRDDIESALSQAGA